MKKINPLEVRSQYKDNTVPMSGHVMAFLRTKVLGLNKSQMAEAVGANRSAITRWERKDENELVASNAFRFVLHKLAGDQLQREIEEKILVD